MPAGVGGPLPSAPGRWPAAQLRPGPRRPRPQDHAACLPPEHLRRRRAHSRLGPRGAHLVVLSLPSRTPGATARHSSLSSLLKGGSLSASVCSLTRCRWVCAPAGARAARRGSRRRVSYSRSEGWRAWPSSPGISPRDRILSEQIVPKELGTALRAVVLRKFGPPEVLVAAEVPDPIPGPGQALIDAEIVNITFVETQVRAGKAPNPAMAPRLPAILGNGVGGLVSQAGPGSGERLSADGVAARLHGIGDPPAAPCRSWKPGQLPPVAPPPPRRRLG